MSNARKILNTLVESERSDAIQLAYEWHGGQDSALYSFASTNGKVWDEAHRGNLEAEIASNIRYVRANPGQFGEDGDPTTPDLEIQKLEALLAFVKRIPVQKTRDPSTLDVGKLDEFTQAYIKMALWSSTDDDDKPMDDNYGFTDIAPETLRKMVDDCARFQKENAEDLKAGEVFVRPALSTGRGGHDFWLTRNGHGAGFWDGDWPEPQAGRLTKAAEAFGTCELYVGDDGSIYAT